MPDEPAGDPDDRGSTIADFAGAAGPGSMPNRYGPGVLRNTAACAAQITHSGAPITDVHQIAITVQIGGYVRARSRPVLVTIRDRVSDTA
jgi:hypothetical protein